MDSTGIFKTMDCTTAAGGTGLSAGNAATKTAGFMSLGSTAAYSGLGFTGLGSTNSVTSPYKDMATYTDRLDTFRTYPVKPYHPRPSELAALGFYYVGRDDKVKCFSCNHCIHNWEASDLVLNEHYRWALGNCRYLNHITSFRL